MSLPRNDRESVLVAVKNLAELGGPEFVQEMLGLLRTQTPDQFRQIDDALAKNDLATVQRLAHSMKSSFGSFGATECQQMATAMDRAAKELLQSEFILEYVKLRQAFDRLQPLLDDATRSIG